MALCWIACAYVVVSLCGCVRLCGYSFLGVHHLYNRSKRESYLFKPLHTDVTTFISWQWPSACFDVEGVALACHGGDSAMPPLAYAT
jgi:hypothetical protein